MNIPRWMKWASAEGLIKTSSILVMKTIGISASSLFGAVLSTAIISLVQLLGGLIGSIVKHESLKIDSQQLVGSIGFGVFASLATWVGLYSFTLEGSDVGIFVFISSLSIIPGLMIGWVIFRQRLKFRQLLGVTLFIMAGYAIIDFPDLSTILNLPKWIWYAMMVPVFLAINEGITQYQANHGHGIRKLDPWVNNFWVGLTTVAMSIIGVGWTLLTDQAHWLFYSFWISSIITGIFDIAMISCKLISYQLGGTIVLKKLVMNGTYLISATLLGALFYGEPLSIGKGVAIVGFFIAFALADEETWQNAVAFVKRKQPERRAEK